MTRLPRPTTTLSRRHARSYSQPGPRTPATIASMSADDTVTAVSALPRVVNVPVLRSLAVSGYGLFPGTADDGLDVTFQPGLTLILGANGLGKSTLVQLLFRLLTGPYDISALTGQGDLGTARLESTPLAPYLRTTFARRVADGAAGATASLSFLLGPVHISIRRRLSDLTLQEFLVDGQPVDGNDVETYQPTVARLAGLASFSDFILCLRYLVFSFEERRALVWDQTAQRQLLRLLFLPSNVGNQWLALEREILQKDSHMRNLQAALTRRVIVKLRGCRRVAETPVRYAKNSWP